MSVCVGYGGDVCCHDIFFHDYARIFDHQINHVFMQVPTLPLLQVLTRRALNTIKVFS